MSAKTKTLDFTGVKDGTGIFRPRRRKEGDYYAHVVAVDDHTSQEGNDGWVFTIKVDGDARATYPYYCNFEAKQLWKSRNLCLAAGLKVPSAKVKMDPNKLVGKAIGIALEDDEYEGRVKSVIGGVFPLDELSDALNEPGSKSSTKAKSRKAEEDDDEDEDDDEEEPPVKSKKAKKRQPEPDDDDEDEDEDEEDEDDEPPAKSKSKKSKAKRRTDDEDDDEDDEPPAKKSKSKSKAKSKKAKDDDDDDDELDLDEL